MEREVIINATYKHFKGFKAKVMGIAVHTETGEKLVVYKCYTKDGVSEGVFARPMEMFLSEVDHDKYPDVKQKYSFELLRLKEVEWEAVIFDDRTILKEDLVLFSEEQKEALGNLSVIEVGVKRYKAVSNNV